MNIKSLFYKISQRFTSYGEELSMEEMDIQENIRNGNVFLESLGQLTADDIAPPKVRTKGEKARVWVKRAILTMLACVFIGGAAWTVMELNHYRKANKVYGDLAENIFNSSLSGSNTISVCIPASQMNPMRDYHSGLDSVEDDTVQSSGGTYNVKLEQMRANLIYLKSLNPDVYGYIHIEGTRISFPIVKGADNEYYLDHAYNGEYMVCGSIFADCRTDETFQNNRNTVFYGHNMIDGNMFNNVMLFKDEEVFTSKLIEIYTLDGIYIFEPFAIFQTTLYYPYVTMSFASDEEFVSFCEKMQGQSLFNKEMTFTGEDQIITLSTCTSPDDVTAYYIGRYALHAKLIRVEQ